MGVGIVISSLLAGSGLVILIAAIRAEEILPPVEAEPEVVEVPEEVREINIVAQDAGEQLVTVVGV